MKIKKNLVAATAAVLAAGMALAGCGSSNGGSGDVQKTADGKVKHHVARLLRSRRQDAGIHRR